MIRRDENEGWVLINQHDHAVLAADIMDYWGSAGFSRPEPGDEMLLAVREHDSGWMQWDALPRLNRDTGEPANFLEMEPKDQTEIWTRCYQAPGREHPYASSLIALHFARFNQKAIDKDPSDESAVTLKRAMKRFVAQNLGIDIKNGNLGEVPEEVKINLKLLQIGDIISLTLCHGWKSIVITDVPRSDSVKSTTLKMESPDGFNFVIAPYPFSEPLLNFSIKCRKLGSKIFPDDAEYRDKLSRAEYETLDFTIRKV